ncbi:MAG: DUF1592 domain-containing protein, partial [Planctomycetales bacterium]|nr:DUF1592 domain-containing protein [Planctomycetales bacterium]
MTSVASVSLAGDLFQESLQPIFAENCAYCHGEGGEVNGGVDLFRIPNGDALVEDAKLLEKLIRVLEFRDMPPADEAELAESDRTRLLVALETLLTQSTASLHAGRDAPMRRMNRFQYNNAVVDLFDLNCVVFSLPERMLRDHNQYFQPATGAMPATVVVGSRPLGKSQMIEPRLGGVAAFPQDLRAENGFDNRGDHLSLSPLLMESFLKLSQSIMESPDFNARRVGIWNEFFAAPPADAELAPIVRSRLRRFLTRAFRRPVDEESLERYTSFVSARLAAQAEFPDAMKAVAAAAIASPRFLYVYRLANEQDTVEPADDFELASQLSFFLWGSIPDDELLDAAQNGRLAEPEDLAAQVDRMLNDRKLKRFCDSFPAQWLQLERILSSTPDPQRYPEFYFSKYRNSMHMMLEPLLLFETVLIENRPITQFLDADFTYRSARLSEAYRLPLPPAAKKNRGNDVTTLAFHRIPLTDRRYGGVITNAAVMTMTSGPERTKPITRGAWLRSVVFNDPPEPPPANVPPLPDKPAAGDEQLTLRERLAQHRQRADCRGCHEKIDPLGFALENFNAVGVWRDAYDNGREIDMSGVLFRDHAFANLVEFKDAVLAEKDRFAEGFAGHMLSFALARELGAADLVAVKRIARATAADDY